MRFFLKTGILSDCAGKKRSLRQALFTAMCSAGRNVMRLAGVILAAHVLSSCAPFGILAAERQERSMGYRKNEMIMDILSEKGMRGDDRRL